MIKKKNRLIDSSNKTLSIGLIMSAFIDSVFGVFWIKETWIYRDFFSHINE